MMNKYNNIQWIVQSNLNFKQDVENISAACDKLGITFQTIDVIPFCDSLPDFDKTKQPIFYGSITMGELILKDDTIKKGLFLNHDTFQMNNYIKQWGDHMLNSSAIITTLDELTKANYNDEEELFLRPNDDNKLFAGVVMKFKDIKEWDKNIKLLGTDFSAPVLVSKPYSIASEWRLWIVKGKVITASKYREYFKTKKEAGCPDEVIKFSEERCKEYMPHDVFVMDICLCGDTYYIVECGCMNNAGFYHGNIETIVKEISDYFTELK